MDRLAENKNRLSWGCALRRRISAIEGLKSLQTRALSQAVRSISLAHASDWPLIKKSDTTIGYANKHISGRLLRLTV
ncbi:DUF1957 domain-containing protein [Candidatus Methylobacter oryzae]|uniref:DUF1957 domain-containing protein n=1 Tax=Candidatus Methylobacter oryzae TaxID=2497749 RepID=A0ABY3CEK4_9GAMM|nr:DUF1957 domain-containing protein [Candidatus Methylobacter oryzae]